MTPEDFYREHLRGLKPGRNGWARAFCPFHDDRDPSLSVNLRTGSWKCFAGCGSGSLGKFADRLGIGIPPTSHPRAVSYPYRGADGELLFEVLRRPGKKFSVRRPDGHGGWKSGLGGVTPVPYRLPELMKGEDPVFVVEGEKDADRLWNIGLPATTNPFGAGKWRPEFSRHLVGRQVFILPDNDEPGRRHASQVKASLLGKANAVKVVELPGLPEGGDVSDWLDARHTKEELLTLCEAAPEEAPWESGAEGGGNRFLSPILGREGLRLPPKYLLNGARLFHEDRGLLTQTPLLPLTHIMDLDTEETGFEVALLDGGEPRALTVPARWLLDQREVLRLAAKGADVSSRTSRVLVAFLQDYLRENALPRRRQTRRLGFCASDGAGRYVLGCQADSPIEFVAEGESQRELARALSPRGTLSGWREAFRAVLPFPPVVCAVLAAVLPALRELLPLEVRSFILHLEAPSSTGKSVAQKVGVSVWADPESPEWLIHGHGTFAGVEALLTRTFGLPAFIEDAHLMRPESIRALVYGVGNEAFKARGGRANAQTRWRGVVITSGEGPLLSEDALGGEVARVLGIPGRPFGEPSEERRRFIDQELLPALGAHHGILGPAVLERLGGLGVGEREALRARWEQARDSYALAAGGFPLLARQAPQWAALELAGAFVQSLLGLIGPSLAEAVRKAFEAAKGAAVPSPTQRAHELLTSYILSNRRSCYIHDGFCYQRPEAPGREEVGAINEPQGSLAVFRHHAERFIRQHMSLSPQVVLSLMRAEGLLRCNRDRLTSLLTLAGQPRRMLVLPWNPREEEPS